MKAALKMALWIAALVALFVSAVALFSSASEWGLYHNYSKYIKEDFVISGTRMAASPGDGGTDYYLQGASADQIYEFAIGFPDYEQYSSPTMIGKTIQVFRNPEPISIAFQKRSLNVIFAEAWRDLDDIRVSARSTLLVGAFSLVFACLFYFVARLALPPLTTRTGTGGGGTE